MPFLDVKACALRNVNEAKCLHVELQYLNLFAEFETMITVALNWKLGPRQGLMILSVKVTAFTGLFTDPTIFLRPLFDLKFERKRAAKIHPQEIQHIDYILFFFVSYIICSRTVSVITCSILALISPG